MQLELPTLDLYGKSTTLKIDNTIDLVSLTPLMVDEWVPHQDCIKCGRNDYCKYAIRRPDDYHNFEYIKCGVVSKFIEQYALLANTAYIEFNDNEKNEFLTSFYLLSKFVFEAESLIGLFQQDNFVSELYDGLLGPQIIGSVADIRHLLNDACSHLQHVTSLSSQRIMLLVEGQSEKDFVEKFASLNSPYFDRIVVESYDGDANKKKGKLHLLLNYFKNKGYKVIIQIDCDGKFSANNFGLQSYINSNLITENDIYEFTYDLESSYETALIAECLGDFGIDSKVVEARLHEDKSKNSTLYNHLNDVIDFMPTKPLFAKAMAELISAYDFFHEKEKETNEAIKFLKFLSAHSMKI